jgi:hypothetical protein
MQQEQLNSWRSWNAENAADSSHGSSFDAAMPGNRSLSEIRRIHPDVVPAAMMVQPAAARA